MEEKGRDTIKTEEKPPSSWQCVKCRCEAIPKVSKMNVTRGFLAKFFNIQNRRFRTVGCPSCGYTELYEEGSDTLENIVDFFGN